MTTHDYEPHPEYPWFCRNCGYAEHERLQHTQKQRTGCPIKRETDGGEYLGMCPHTITDDCICPLHGDVELACVRLYDTGYATSERYHMKQMSPNA